jgi:hypothetical protein
MRLLTVCAIILATCIGYWLDAASAQQRVEAFDANGNKAVALSR